MKLNHLQLPESVQERFRLSRCLLLKEFDAALHVDGGGAAECARRVHPVVQDDQTHHHA